MKVKPASTTPFKPKKAKIYVNFHARKRPHKKRDRATTITLKGMGLKPWPSLALKCDQNRNVQRAGPVLPSMHKNDPI